MSLQEATACGPGKEKTSLWGFVNNKGTDQPAGISLGICRLATSEISILFPVSVAEQTGFNLTSSETSMQTLFFSIRKVFR